MKKLWLIKSDPDEFSAGDLEREGRTTWDGVSNAVALKHLRAMAVGDALLIYHTGDERAIVAVGEVAGKPKADPRDMSGKLSTVEISFTRRLGKPVSLTDIKADPAFANFELVRIGRLSIMPVPSPLWERIMKLAGEK